MSFTNIKSPNRMNTNRNIPYNYNVKDIDWPGLKAVSARSNWKRTATLTCCCKARNQKSSR